MNRSMSHIFADKNFKEARRQLRRKMTEAEGILWSKIRNRQLGKYKFRRQYSIGTFIVDFYCPEAELVIEVDGGHHGEPKQADYDKIRTRYFNSLGIKVVRYWNSDILENIDGVADDLLRKIEKRIK